MEKFLEIITNPYIYLFATALIIMGITQLFKLIPCLKDTNWNILFPILLGYGSAIGWAFLTKCDIIAKIGEVLTYGTAITTLSSFLYSILKKIFSKDYKLLQEIKKNPIYLYLSELFTVKMAEFSNKTTMEKYSLIISVAGGLNTVISKLKSKDSEGAKVELNTLLGKFISSTELSETVENFLNIIKKNNGLDNIQTVVKNLTKPQ